VNIGAVAAVNNGIINNCSVNIVYSEIVFNADNENKAEKTTYNIGLVAGLNNKTISYDNTVVGSNYAYMVDVCNAGKLFITILIADLFLDLLFDIQIISYFLSTFAGWIYKPLCKLWQLIF
jgi:hypothetical protein